MQDRLYFRIWDEDNKCFDYINLLEDLDNTINKLDSLGDYFYKKYLTENPQYIQQCTSLKDNNGKLIFEGDIVNLITELEEIAIIKWDNDIARFVIENDVIKADFDFYYGNELEVIGNVYETPELLKEVNNDK